MLLSVRWKKRIPLSNTIWKRWVSAGSPGSRWQLLRAFHTRRVTRIPKEEAWKTLARWLPSGFGHTKLCYDHVRGRCSINTRWKNLHLEKSNKVGDEATLGQAGWQTTAPGPHPASRLFLYGAKNGFHRLNGYILSSYVSPCITFWFCLLAPKAQNIYYLTL